MCYKKDLFPSFFYTIIFDFITKFENFNSSPCWALFIDASGSRLKKIERPWWSRKMGAFMRFERERKNGRRPRDKKYPATKQKIRPVQLNGPHSKGCWVFIYSGRGQSTFDYSTVTSRNPLQLLEHPRF